MAGPLPWICEVNLFSRKDLIAVNPEEANVTH